ncbi:protein translocase subunit SecA [Deltaproteobacteria bacterium]|nr:protein translocase subunit SecA [Deltaproteobacteria bacterium]
MISFLFRKIFGSKNERFLKRQKNVVAAIAALEEKMRSLRDDEFPAKIAEYRERHKNGEHLDALLPEVFALTREASVRALAMRPFDVQLIGGIALHQGKIAEMKTGEGKTLVATLPVVLNSLAGKGVHVVTVNDYLAKRDAAWMGKLYAFLGLSVGVVVHGISDAERKAAYNADITYGTNNEFGFDYLRDNMKFQKEQLAQRPHHYAIVDEVDSILIDEARTPLIISGPAEESTDLYRRVDAIIPRLKQEEYSIDEKARSASLTDEGVAQCERLLGVDNLFDPQNISLQHHTLQALKAHKIFKRDVDYVVADNKVVIVDEFTGRLMEGRRFSDGLHQALEAKEHVKVEAENQTLASITFQNYFRLYEKLAGMTGTADTEAVEFNEIYRLEVLSIPTNCPMIRKDMADVIYRTRQEKYAAILDALRDLHTKGQPVLVGTISIETSELLSSMLKKAGVPHNVLNAKHHEMEASIIAEAGQKGKVTIATNMAGRGTDIVLGEGVRELGGLHILGTERHESRRIDNQLRGRSGRQGDPGSSRFYLSLEDDLMRLFGSERIAGIMQTLGLEEGESIEHRMISRAIENAQKRVEGHNFEIRKSLLDFDNVMNQQREVIYSLRRETMLTEDSETLAMEFLDDVIADIYAPVFAAKGELEPEQEESVAARLTEVVNLPRFWQKEGIPGEEEAKEGVVGIFAGLKNAGMAVYQDILRYFLLEELDRCWKEHLLGMDHLRDGIGLRGYGQRDPKQEYKREGFAMFQDMLFRIRENVLKSLTRVRLQLEPLPETGEIADEAPRQAVSREFKHKETPANLSYSGESTAKVSTVKRDAPKVGRNDDCPCGSGKKYKKCCGTGK